MMSARAAQVARLHQENLPGSFLATLGVPFLTLMYEALAGAEDAFLITEEQGGHVIGFISGGTGMQGTYRGMVRRPVRLGVSLMPSLFRPRRLFKILEILRYGKASTREFPRAELLSLAVDPAWRGMGVADRLYSGLVSEFRVRGVAQFKIVVGSSLRPALRFYERMGARPAGEISIHGRDRSVVLLDG